MEVVFVTAGSNFAHVNFKTDDLSGTESQIHGLAKEIVNRGHQVKILRKGPRATVTKTSSGVQMVDIPVSPPVKRLGQIATKLQFSRKAEQYIRKHNADIVNVTMKYATIFTCTLPQPIIHFAFNNPSAITPDTGLPARIVTGTVENWIMAHADAIVVRNSTVEEWVRKRASGITKHIPCGINPNNYDSNGDKKYILYAGRFVSLKNVKDIILAYNRLPNTVQEEYKLRLVGEGPAESRLRSLSADLNIVDNVEFQPWIAKPELRKVISQSSCVVLASDQEGMPVFAIEAMGCAKPVVGSNVPGIKDLIEDQITGLLFKRGDVSELAHTLEHILRNTSERQCIGMAGREMVEQRYSFEHVADEYLDLYREVLN